MSFNKTPRLKRNGKAKEITKCNTIKDCYGDTIRIKKYIDTGADGIVYEGVRKDKNDVNKQESVAVKFFLPVQQRPLRWSGLTAYTAFAENFQERYFQEFSRLEKLPIHPNVQRLISSGKLERARSYFVNEAPRLDEEEEVPFIVSRFVRGTRLDRLIEDKKLTPRLVILLVSALSNTLCFLYEHKVLHGDIREENIVIDEETQCPVLVDFGIAKAFDENITDKTRLEICTNNIPKWLEDWLKKKAGTNEYERDRLRDIVFPFSDLYQVGCLIKNLSHAPLSAPLEVFESDYLSIIGQELLLWDNDGTPERPRSKFTGFITSPAQLFEKVERLIKGKAYYSHATILKRRRESSIELPTQHAVTLRESLSVFLTHPALRRLQNLHQLALLYYLYPSATQSRFDHVLSATDRVRAIIQTLTGDPWFVFHMDFSSVERLELVTLLHDLNHFPFLHYFQEAGIDSVTRAEVLKTFLDLRGHDGQQTLRELIKGFGLTEEYLKTILSDIVPKTPVDQVIKSIVNSGIDVDKLAYLVDDATFTGVPFGNGIDLFGILEGIQIDQPATASGDPRWHTVFSIHALPAIESVCFARYWNFQRIYWHETNRALAAMVIWTIRKLYSDPSKHPEKFLSASIHLGESGALDYLADEYEESFKQTAPIAGLASDPGRAYLCVFEMDYTEENKLISDLQHDKSGPEARMQAQQRVFDLVKSLFPKNSEISESEVLLDIPLRTMNLGGDIFIRRLDGKIVDVTQVSSPLKALKEKFNQMSKVLRVFVSPRVKRELAIQGIDLTTQRNKISSAIAPPTSVSQASVMV